MNDKQDQPRLQGLEIGGLDLCTSRTDDTLLEQL